MTYENTSKHTAVFILSVIGQFFGKGSDEAQLVLGKFSTSTSFYKHALQIWCAFRDKTCFY